MTGLTARIVAIALSILFVALSCSFPDTPEPQGLVTPSLTFEDRDTIPATAVRAIYPAPDASLQALEDFYDGSVSDIGSLVGSYTPSEFRLFIDYILLYNDDVGYQLDVRTAPESETDPSVHYADFVEPVTLVPDVGIVPGTYTGLLFRFAAVHSVVSGTIGDQPFSVRKESLIGVTIPGYGGVAWSDEESSQLPGAYRVRHIENDYFEFAPEYLQPYSWDSIWESYFIPRIPLIERFAYLKDSPYRAILPGQDGHPGSWTESDPNATATPPDFASQTNGGAVIMPFEGLVIPEDAVGVEFSVQWDLDGIVEVYDHGSAAEDSSTDDVVVLAANFWERFSLVPRVQYE